MCNKEERYRGRDREREREREVKLEQTKLKRRAVGSVRIRTCINSKGKKAQETLRSQQDSVPSSVYHYVSSHWRKFVIKGQSLSLSLSLILIVLKNLNDFTQFLNFISFSFILPIVFRRQWQLLSLWIHISCHQRLNAT